MNIERDPNWESAILFQQRCGRKEFAQPDARVGDEIKRHVGPRKSRRRYQNHGDVIESQRHHARQEQASPPEGRQAFHSDPSYLDQG